MNNSGIIKTLDIRKENMRTWEISDDFVKNLEIKYSKEENGDYKWPKMVGAMQGELASIMIKLSVYHPEAFKFIAQERFNEIV